jgi:hypothetical protein
MVAQCQADQRLWRSQFEEAKDSLTFEALMDMSGEMEACYKVDPPNATKYQDTEAEDIVIQATRKRVSPPDSPSESAQLNHSIPITKTHIGE